MPVPERIPEGPGERARAAARFTSVCGARTAGGQTRRGVLRGSDVYGTTAATLAEGAQRLARGECAASGALAPARAFDLASFTAAPGDDGR